MNSRICLLPLAFMVLSSCATLNVTEIKNLSKEEFEPLRLVPETEPLFLRIDLIRQTHDVKVNDSTSKSEDKPYHVMGFDLGNGIFYDLNENLCLIINKLPGFSGDEEFVIKEISRPKNKAGFIVHSFSDDTLTLSYRSGKKTEYVCHRTSSNDTVSWWYKKHLKYSVIHTDSSLIYSGRKHPLDIIHKVNENEYYLNRKRWNEKYLIDSNNVFLENDKVVSISDDLCTIRIMRKGRKKNHLLYTMEKDDHALYIYNDKYCGKKIVIDNNMLTLYRDNYILKNFELVN